MTVEQLVGCRWNERSNAVEYAPEGNKLILDTMRGMADFKRQQGEIAREALTGRISRQEAIDRLYALPDPLASFREGRKAVEAKREGVPPPAQEAGEVPASAKEYGITPSQWERMPQADKDLFAG